MEKLGGQGTGNGEFDGLSAENDESAVEIAKLKLFVSELLPLVSKLNKVNQVVSKTSDDLDRTNQVVLDTLDDVREMGRTLKESDTNIHGLISYLRGENSESSS